MQKIKLSVVLATRNEEKNIARCLNSVKQIADEIVVFDENSTDKTREIAKRYGARVYKVLHEPIFHKTKQKALDLARGDWILQLDADERVTKELVGEIKQIINSPNDRLLDRVLGHGERSRTITGGFNRELTKLFESHQQLIEQRDGPIGKRTGEVVAFFIPRLNMFLGRPLKYAGTYPDPAIRLVKKDKAWFPAKSVHEIMEVEGEVGWLQNYMEHHDSPTLSRYFNRLNRYTDLKSQELQKSETPKNFIFLIHYSFFKPFFIFLNLYIRHKGFLDGMRGFLWSFFSASHFPIAYFKYWQK